MRNRLIDPIAGPDFPFEDRAIPFSIGGGLEEAAAAERALVFYYKNIGTFAVAEKGPDFDSVTAFIDIEAAFWRGSELAREDINFFKSWLAMLLVARIIPYAISKE